MTAAPRRTSYLARVGGVNLGGGAPVVVQSMTNTDTADAEGTARQVAELAEAGSEVVRITVNNRGAAARVAEIRDRLRDQHGLDTPLIGDFHYNGHTLLREFPDAPTPSPSTASTRATWGAGPATTRTSPPWCRPPSTTPSRFGSASTAVARPRAARRADGRERAPRRAARADAVVRQAWPRARCAPPAPPRSWACPPTGSCSRARRAASRTWWPSTATWPPAASTRCTWASPRRGWAARASSSTTAALAILLQDGIGDTIRASLTPEPGGDRTIEVRVCRELLQSLGLRALPPEVTACPGCGRTTSTVFQELAQTIEWHLERRMAEWRSERPGVAA